MTANNKHAVKDSHASQPEAPTSDPMDKLIEKHGNKVIHSLNSSDMVHSELNTNKRGFQPGNKLAVGQKRGKQKLTNAFVDDLSYEWSKRGQAALSELTGDKLVQACIAILPKDVLVSMNQDAKVQWVINATPNLSTSEWLDSHSLPQPIELEED